MFSIGFGELAVICIVLILAVGPERLPGMMKTVGKTMRTLRQASRDIRTATGIDELMREDITYTPPRPQRPAPPVGPAPVSRAESPAAVETASATTDPAGPSAPAAEPKPAPSTDSQ
jgi:sec-independent protein translocase protein TatB